MRLCLSDSCIVNLDNAQLVGDRAMLLSRPDEALLAIRRRVRKRAPQHRSVWRPYPPRRALPWMSTKQTVWYRGELVASVHIALGAALFGLPAVSVVRTETHHLEAVNLDADVVPAGLPAASGGVGLVWRPDEPAPSFLAALARRMVACNAPRCLIVVGDPPLPGAAPRPLRAMILRCDHVAAHAGNGLPPNAVVHGYHLCRRSAADRRLCLALDGQDSDGHPLPPATLSADLWRLWWRKRGREFTLLAAQGESLPK